MTEQGRLPHLAHVPADKSVVQEHEERKAAVRDMLRNMEHGEPKIMALWSVHDATVATAGTVAVVLAVL